MARQSLIKALAVSLAIIAITAPLSAGPALAATDGEDAVTLPTDTPLNSDASVQEYEQTGVVNANVGAPQMGIIIGDEREDVGLGLTLDPLDGSTRNDFIRVEHQEQMTRTVRIPIRSDYWKPFPRERLESLSGDKTARMEPVQIDGGTYTLLTVTFDGEESAVFPIPEDAIAVYRASERTEDNVNSTFGISLGVTPTPWSEVPESVFGNETAVRIEGEPSKMMIQYNAGIAGEPQWLSVPDEQKSGVPVYRMEKEGVDGAVYVVSRTNETPTVRYKTQSNIGDRVSLYIREAQSLPGRIADGFGFELPDIDLGLTVAFPTGVVR